MFDILKWTSFYKFFSFEYFVRKTKVYILKFKEKFSMKSWKEKHIYFVYYILHCYIKKIYYLVKLNDTYLKF